MTRISALTALTSADSGDTLPILDVSATTTKKITKTNFLSDIIDGTLITSQKILSRHVDFSVADSTARLALASPFEGMECYQEDVDATYIYDGSAWRRQAQWEELGRTTLGVAGDTLAITSFAARKHLKVVWHIWSTGGTITMGTRFNNDSAANYSESYSIDASARATNVSQTKIFAFSPVDAAGILKGSFEVANVSSQYKLPYGYGATDNNAGAATAPTSSYCVGKWANNSSQITRIDLINAGTGDYAIGSEIVVLGRD